MAQSGKQPVTSIDLANQVIEGSRIATAKMISLAENDWVSAFDALEKLDAVVGKAYVIGITGYPGVGKSTLVSKMIKSFRTRGLSVGVLAVDPSSPFTGGSILGDRFRMDSVDKDDEVFIRSLATRGQLGGLSRVCPDAVRIMDASGKDIIIIETVGIGQDEVDVLKLADCCLLVLMPGTGDEVQLIKAGIMEIADLFIINKADHPWAENLSNMLDVMLGTSSADGEWQPPIVSTVATEDKGIAELMERIEEFRVFQRENGVDKEKAKDRIRWEIGAVIEKEVYRKVGELLKDKFDLDVMADDAISGKKGVYSWARDIIDHLNL